MKKGIIVPFVISFFSFALMNHAGMCQHIDIDTKEIETLIREWDFANNTRSVESFQNVYGEPLLFYTQTLSKSKAIELKQKLFKLNPEFRQKIITEITYTPYTSGMIKCDFAKEVREETRSRKYPSYLLVSYEDNRYRIVGESDYATDRTLRYKLDIGEPIRFEEPVDKQDTNTPSADSSLTAMPPSDYTVQDSAQMMVTSRDLSSILSPLSSMGTVTIPKGYVFILIGMLAVGGTMIFIAASGQKRKRKTGASLPQQDEATNVIHELQMQSVFESFVITLFDPLYFKYRRPKAERVFAGKISEGDSGPDFEFEFNHKEAHAKFAIKCLYYKNSGTNELQLLSRERQQAFRNFEDEREMEVYYVLGLGGTPDDPKELLLVPAVAVGTEFVTKESLKPFRKSGMFFYNRAMRRLQ